MVGRLGKAIQEHKAGKNGQDDDDTPSPTTKPAANMTKEGTARNGTLSEEVVEKLEEKKKPKRSKV